MRAQLYFGKRNILRRLLKISFATLPLLMTSCGLLNPQISDSFCTSYLPVRGIKGVGAISAPTEVKARLAANEKTHLCTCPDAEGRVGSDPRCGP